MNRPLQSAGRVLVLASAAVTVLAGVALLAPRAAGRSSHSSGDRATALPVAGPGVIARWRRLDESLEAMQQRIDGLATRQDKATLAAQQQASRSQEQLKIDLHDDLQQLIAVSLGRVHDQWLQETTRRAGDRSDGITSIERKLEELARSVQSEAIAGRKFRGAFERQQPALAVTASGRPGRFSIVARRVPLADVLAQLGELSRWEIRATAAARTPVSVARLDDVTVEEALEVLLPAAGCAAKLEGRRVFVMSAEAARRERQRLAAAKRL